MTDLPNGFAFAFNTIMNCHCLSFFLTDNYNNKPCFDKVVDRCNIFGSDNALTEAIYLESADTFCLTIDECVIMSNDKGIISYKGENIKLVLQSCILSQEINDDMSGCMNSSIPGHTILLFFGYNILTQYFVSEAGIDESNLITGHTILLFLDTI
ncbi:hypothetical protein M9Y10_041874 [Tritrichomonas musculus]|uniref:Uncharacterized protein n=1 Tax=Tritrichomonas musculus TaxID=1915356 RepID=A0ABR2K675_9EUKA